MRPWRDISGEGEGVSPTSSAETTRTRRRSPAWRWTPTDPWWAVGPKQLHIAGTLTETYPVAAMAAVLGRSTASVRRWEAAGILPPPPFVELGASWQGDRRRYQRGHVEAAGSIAEEEGIVGVKVANFADCQFTTRIWQAYALLADR